MLAAIRRHFVDPHAFEACAAVIWAMYAPSSDYTLTSPTRDGGRDAYGYYKLGPKPIRFGSTSPWKQSAMPLTTASACANSLA